MSRGALFSTPYDSARPEVLLEFETWRFRRRSIVHRTSPVVAMLAWRVFERRNDGCCISDHERAVGHAPRRQRHGGYRRPADGGSIIMPKPLLKHKLAAAAKLWFQPQLRLWKANEYGGDREDRTPDLLIANQTLSQLSYAPRPKHFMGRRKSAQLERPFSLP
jgi:hypothetical protein